MQLIKTRNWFSLSSIFPVLFVSMLAVLCPLSIFGYNVPTNGLTAHWNFDDNLANSFSASGNSVNGPQNLQLVQVNGAGFAGGLFGQAAHFDGTDDYLEIFNPFAEDKEIVEDEPVGINHRTISVWFKADSAPLGSERFMVYETAPNFTFSLGLREATDTSKTKVQVYSDLTSSSDPFTSVDLPDSEIAGKWVHVLLTYRIQTSGPQEVTLGLVVNNATSNEITVPYTTGPRSFDDFHIGTFRNANGRWFPGLIDELAVWERELTPSEQNALSTRPPFVVTTLDDEDDGISSVATLDDISLREAILYAPVGEVITFSPSLSEQTIALIGGQLEITNSLTIDASAIGGITINGTDSSRIFAISGGGTVAALNTLTLTGGSAPDGTESSRKGADGGGILNQGTLSLVDCHLFGNTAGGGYTLNLGDSGDDGHGGNGGGIYNSGNLTVQNSTISGNQSGNGGFSFAGGSIGGHGGGIYNNGTLTLLNSTLTENSTGTGDQNDHRGSGGGIYTTGSATLLHATLIDNSVDQGDTFPGIGYGICNVGGSVNSTNSIIAEIPASPIVNISGRFTDSNNLTTDNVMLAPLDDYGGPTPTMPPLPGSPAINTGSSINPGGTDQRGYPRFVGGALDIGAVEAQPSVVLNSNDDGAGSLRAILSTAVPGFPITFTNTLSEQTIQLTSGQLLIDKSVQIDASTIGGITIDGNANSRIFEITGGDTISTLHSLTLTNGFANGFLREEVDGGAIFINAGATLSILNSTITGNEAELSGGGIKSLRSTLTVEHSTIAGNAAEGSGGIDSERGLLTITDSTISDNAASYPGGGLFNYLGTMVVEQSTLSGNTTFDHGGGIYSYIQEATNKTSLFNCTFYNNNASNDGGAIYNSRGLVELTHCTLAGNVADLGAGIFSYGHSTTTVKNSIIADNIPSDVSTGEFINTFSSLNHNLVGTGNGLPAFIQPNDQTNAYAQLAPFSHYGGATPTMPLLPGHPAIDAIGSFDVATDQRNLARIGLPDIGAVEYQGASDNTLFWSLDTDGDGNPFGVEYALGTDWHTADGTYAANLSALSSGGVAFGFNPAATNEATWVVKRSMDLMNDPFVEIYRYYGATGATTTNSVPLSINQSASSIELIDQSGATNAYYRFEAWQNL